MAAVGCLQLNLNAILKKVSAEKLLNILNSIEGTKDLVLDKELISSLEYIVNFSQLKTCEVEKVYKLEPGSTPGNTPQCVYIIRPSIQKTQVISDHINAGLSIGSVKKYCIIFVPRMLYKCEKVLEREGVYGNATLMDFPLGFLPIDKDLFSLEISDFYRAFYLKSDLAYIHTAAMSLVQLCKICGSITKISGQGKCAKMVVDMMNLMMKELKYESPISDSVSHLIVLDRGNNN